MARRDRNLAVTFGTQTRRTPASRLDLEALEARDVPCTTTVDLPSHGGSGWNGGANCRPAYPQPANSGACTSVFARLDELRAALRAWLTGHSSPAPASGSISGVGYNDLDGNGTREAAEPGMANQTVYLDANNNAVLDPGEKSTTTDANGAYEFNNLPGGTYFVRTVTTDTWTATGNVPYMVTVVQGQTTTGVNLGVVEEVFRPT
jgi:hypothetical protein